MTTKNDALRHLIREMIDEMAYGGTMAGIDLKPSQDTERDDGWTSVSQASKSSAAIDKYHRTPTYTAKALATFAAFPYDVFVVPVATRRIDLWGNLTENRVKVMTPGEGLKSLETLRNKHGVALDVEDIASKLSGGSTVILSLTQMLSKNFLPTPWMLVHALFETDWSHFEDEKWEVDSAMEEMGLSMRNTIKFATMKSARDNNVQSDADFVSEMLTQAVVTKAGLRFNKEIAKKPETVEKLTRLETLVNDEIGIRQKVFDKLKGKIVVVNGYVPQ